MVKLTSLPIVPLGAAVHKRNTSIKQQGVFDGGGEERVSGAELLISIIVGFGMCSIEISICSY